MSGAYTYASPLGSSNIWIGAELLAGGTRLKWFGFRPAPVTASAGRASVDMLYGYNSPPPSVTTDQIEFFMYVGGAQVFSRKMFSLRLDWRL